MKTRVITFFFILVASVSFGQNSSQPIIQSTSTDSNVVFRLFKTTNNWTFIKLDTRNGKMWQVQWNTSDNRFETPLSLTPLVTSENESNGRFFLYPTTNIYNFVLLDQIDGRTWQVQWSTEDKNKMVVRIY